MIVDIALGIVLAVIILWALPVILASITLLAIGGIAIGMLAGAIALLIYFPEHVLGTAGAIAAVVALQFLYVWIQSRVNLWIRIDEVAVVLALYFLVIVAGAAFAVVLSSASAKSDEATIMTVCMGVIFLLLISASYFVSKAFIRRAFERRALEQSGTDH